jgi:uncharacterized protein (DUF2147 family)
MKHTNKFSTLKMNLSLACVLVTTLGWGQTKNGIVGTWWDEEKRSRIEIHEEGGKFHGTIVWIKKDENDDGIAPRKDIHNPDAKLKNTRILNLRILHHLEWDTENKEWKNGAIYDPDNGKTYTCFATLQKDGKMFLKGYVMGMRFLGRSTLWTKFDK